MKANIHHFLRPILHVIIKIFTFVLRFTPSKVGKLSKRLSQSPGIPVPGSSASYWLIPPSPISKHGSDGSVPLPDYADVVVIGSGITGTSFTRALMQNSAKGDEFLTVVMLEARDACSGATGRNGGHITPPVYDRYSVLKKEFGAKVAQEIIQFRLKHIAEFLSVAAEEGLLEDSQCREVETFGVFYDKDLFLREKKKLSGFQRELPLEGSSYKIYEGAKAFEKLQLSSKVAGCLSMAGGAIHPYRFVTGILERLLKLYPKNFYLFTHTPCTAINTCRQGVYEVSTPKGTIKTRHVVHATNGWVSHLLPGMKKRIFPGRGVMTAQTPRKGLGRCPDDKDSWTSTRSFTFYPGKALDIFDYLTQQTITTDKKIWPAPQGEFMFGGGFWNSSTVWDEVANADDRTWNEETGTYLGKALSGYFEVKDGDDDDDKEEVKMTWSGILGVSSDEVPWVGRVPEIVSGRKMTSVKAGKTGMAAPGEWIAAGYSGEGMVHALLCGQALAEMVGGGTGDGLPSGFRMDYERWKRTGIEDLIVRLFLS